MHFSFVDMTSHEVSNRGPVLLLMHTNVCADQEPTVVCGIIPKRRGYANPSRAVVHCADSIIDSLSDMSKLVKQRGSTPGSSLFRPEDETKLLTEAIGSSLEAVETISSCTSHMRRIIDDILTLSKLDTNLLKIAPSPVDTGAFINTIQKMLEIDAERVGVVLQAQADMSVSKLNAAWVEIDPGRVTQVCSAWFDAYRTKVSEESPLGHSSVARYLSSYST